MNRALRILVSIESHVRCYGRAPSRRELASFLGLGIAVIAKLLRELSLAGFVERGVVCAP